MLAGPSASMLLVDPRPAQRFAEGHLPGARNITLADVSTNARPTELASADKRVVYANDPGAPTGIGMAKRLVQLGYGDVYLLEGGLLGWKLAGGKLESTVP